MQCFSPAQLETDIREIIPPPSWPLKEGLRRIWGKQEKLNGNGNFVSIKESFKARQAGRWAKALRALL